MSKDLKEVTQQAMWLSGGKASQVEVPAYAKALRWRCSQCAEGALRRCGWLSVSEGVAIRWGCPGGYSKDTGSVSKWGPPEPWGRGTPSSDIHILTF